MGKWRRLSNLLPSPFDEWILRAKSASQADGGDNLEVRICH